MLSIVIPVYNNQDSLDLLHAELRSVMISMERHYEIIFINDNSTDESGQYLSKLKKSFHNITILTNLINVGQHKSIIAGLKMSKGDLIIVLDADMQDNPRYIPEMLAELRDPYHAVFALRRGKYASSIRMIESRLFKSIIFLLIRLPVRAGTYFIIDDRVREKVLRMHCANPYITIMIASCRLKFTGVQVERSTRPDHKSSYSFFKRVKASFRGFTCLLRCILDQTNS